jgi:hypothetical protein
MHRDENQRLEVRHCEEVGGLRRRDQKKFVESCGVRISFLDPDVGCMPTRRRGNSMVVSWELVIVGLKGCRTSTYK